MSYSYLIEIRMFGKAKYDIRELILRTSRQFEVHVPRPVPHITLVGGFSTNYENRLIKDFESVCSRVGLIGYVIEGIDVFVDTGVIYLDIQPSKELITFRRELRDRLCKYCNLSKWDFVEPFEFHSTVVMHQSLEKISAIKRDLKYQRYSHRMLRATLLKDGKILVEYDFLLKKVLNRREALSKQVLDKTLIALSNTNNHYTEKQIFVTSDLHLGHYNIIRYCKRPFNNLDDMNTKLVNNWNSVISPKDTVYFLGDLAYGKNSSTDYWLCKLNGNIIFFRGNHDSSANINFIDSDIVTIGDIQFFLTHTPDNVPADWNGWIIHGHHHNNQLDNYPFINYNRKTINISVELTNYKPVNINTILRLVKLTKN